MNDKLIIRAANQYIHWFNKSQNIASNKIINQIRTQSEYLHSASKSIKTITGYMRKNILLEKQFDTYNDCIIEYDVPRLKRTMLSRIEMIDSDYKMLLKQNKRHLSLKDIIEEIRAVVSSFCNVEYKNNTLSVLIRDVVLSDGISSVELGSFKVGLDFNNYIEILRIIPIDEIMSSGGYQHPHVSGKHLCSGDGEEDLQNTLYCGRLEDYFTLVESTLRTYNKKSVYEELIKWYDPDSEDRFYCDQCEEFVDEENTMCCVECSDVFCCNCNDSGECNGCCQYTCDNCAICCRECDNIVCSNCSEKCDSCNHMYCDQCLTNCSECATKTCQKCSLICRICDECHCDECGMEDCVKCGYYICKDCLSRCPDCDTEMCKDCMMNECEYCGIAICKKCDEQHNCCLEDVSN